MEKLTQGHRQLMIDEIERINLFVYDIQLSELELDDLHELNDVELEELFWYWVEELDDFEKHRYVY